MERIKKKYNLIKLISSVSQYFIKFTSHYKLLNIIFVIIVPG